MYRLRKFRMVLTFIGIMLCGRPSFAIKKLSTDTKFHIAGEALPYLEAHCFPKLRLASFKIHPLTGTVFGKTTAFLFSAFPSLSKKTLTMSEFVRSANERYLAPNLTEAQRDTLKNHLQLMQYNSNAINKIDQKERLLIGGSLLLLLLSVSIQIYFYQQKKKLYRQTSAILEAPVILEQFDKYGEAPFKEADFGYEAKDVSQTTAQDAQQISDIPLPTAPASQNAQKGSSIPMETQLKILQKLDFFESSHLYTQPNLSLSYLSAHVETNNKYLSYIINHYKQKDFNHYINDLRIHYVVTKLQQVPAWRTYKISALATEAGFSSHKKFSAIFKQVMGITPSLFIQDLEVNEGLTKL